MAPKKSAAFTAVNILEASSPSPTSEAQLNSPWLEEAAETFIVTTPRDGEIASTSFNTLLHPPFIAVASLPAPTPVRQSLPRQSKLLTLQRCQSFCQPSIREASDVPR
ncbi:hypothetical protein F4823DRAFT_558977 [Ustulina deusta]|nr:hypothetical protein F4823DRAFT_558977 [Ustulina deusta]